MLVALLVFLSYSHVDTALALKLRADLVRSGCVVQMDRDIRPGRDWTRSIERMIDRSDVVVVLVSDNPSVYVRAEYLRAIRKKRRVIPVLKDPSADIPIPLEPLQMAAPGEVTAAVGCKSK
jgi:hypothetical protein